MAFTADIRLTRRQPGTSEQQPLWFRSIGRSRVAHAYEALQNLGLFICRQQEVGFRMPSRVAMKQVKFQRIGGLSPGVVIKAVAVRAADSDDYVDAILPTPTLAAGSNAYELLLGGLDGRREVSASKTRSKASKVKTRQQSPAGATQERAVDSTPAEQPLHDSNDASSSDDRSGGATDQPEDVPEVTDQAVADFFTNHFDSSSKVPADDGQTSSTWKDVPGSFPDWPGTSWLTTGQSLPQVCSLLCGGGYMQQFQELVTTAMCTQLCLLVNFV